MRKVEEMLQHLRKAREKIEIIEELLEEYLKDPEQFNEDSLQRTVAFACGFVIALLEMAEQCTHFRWTCGLQHQHSSREAMKNEEKSD
jgi:hypothetical protein